MNRSALKNDIAAAKGAGDLRGTLEWLNSHGDFIETDKDVAPTLR